jgi:hypothetical protein
MVEEIVVTDSEDRKSFNTMNFFTDDYIHLNLDTVAWVEFIDSNNEDYCRNFCRDGLK